MEASLSIDVFAPNPIRRTELLFHWARVAETSRQQYPVFFAASKEKQAMPSLPDVKV